MREKDIFRLIFQQYRTNKTRHTLCFLAVAIGAFSIILLSHIGSFASEQVIDALDSLGLQGMTLFIKDQKNGESLSTAFAEYLEAEIPEISATTPVKFALGTYKNGHQSGNAALIGYTGDISRSLNIPVLYGRSIPDETIVDVRNPVVISRHFANSLFKRDNVIGKTLYFTINGKQERYTIIGVAEDQTGLFNSILGGYMPELAYVNLERLDTFGTADQILFSTDVGAQEILPVVQSAAAVSFGMESEISVQNLSGYEEQIADLLGKAESILSVFSSFSMIVAAFTIESSMISAMQEMREELMLYRTIGFRRKDVIKFFGMQSVLVCLFGSLIGILFGWLVIQIISLCIANSFHFHAYHLIKTMIVTVVLGILSAVLPVWQALKQIKKELYD